MSCGKMLRKSRALIVINNTPPTLHRARLLNNRSVLRKAVPSQPEATYVLDLARELKLEVASVQYDLYHKRDYTNIHAIVK